jgi:CMP-N,N'-diacetyllegionaminic acid synthase
MSTVAIVPARGGSKGIPRKNLRVVGGRTLVGWSILAGLEADLVDEVVVTSDDHEILEEAVRCGARPLLRPDELATDEASTDSVLVHAMNALGWQHGLVVLLQPTVPVRPPGLVDAAIRRLLDTGADSLFTGEPLHFVWRRVARSNHSGTLVPGPLVQINCRGQRIRRQDFEWADERWREDGSVFVCRSKLLAETRCRLGGRIEVLQNARTVDIDTEEQLRVASAMLTSRL